MIAPTSRSNLSLGILAAMAAAHAIRLNGGTTLAITKMRAKRSLAILLHRFAG
jgi:hypothetical protein